MWKPVLFAIFCRIRSLSRINIYTTLKMNTGRRVSNAERGELIPSELNLGESLEYTDQIRREGTISNVKIIDAGTLGDAYDNNSKLVIYWVSRKEV